MHTLFVTGATGFIGTHLVHELVRRGIRCKCLVRASSKTDHLPTHGVEYILGSIEDPNSYRAALEGCDTVIHLAGVVTGLNEAQFLKINGDGCATLADACLETSRPPKLVSVSSVAASGPPPIGVTVRDETHAPAPVSLYGKSKLRGEVLLAERADKMPITIVRPGIVYGPRDTSLLEMARPIYRWRLHVVVGFRTPPLSLIYVDDLVQFILTAAAQGECLRADSESTQGIYFATDDSEFPTYWELGQRVGQSLNRRVFVWPVWRWVGWCIGFVSQNITKLTKRTSLLTVDKIREATVRSWACSGQKAREQLGFAPARSLDENLRQTLRWYIEHNQI
ncbi:MAG: NAD-dependent epimerase/dehydratase family protein [Planctomycetaceae bacterium]|nr:NAD-dependent epimerase/dehydratase family protein [Planctomycetales bacterium]MCB9923264.1 NAD-dependent epimerase/dehydratase family protein [Planctomycetaceae bacterium]